MKKIKQLFLVCAVAFMLCGCFKANVNIEVKSDGTANMNMEMLVAESMLTYMNASVDDLKESMMQSMDEETKKTITFKDITKTYDKEKYVGFEVTYDSKSTKKADFANVITVNKDDTITFTMDKEAIGSMGTDELQGYSDSMEGIEFNMNITMPGKILKNNVGEVKDKTVKIDLLKFNDSKIEITSEKGKTDYTMIIVGVVAAVIVIAGVAFFIVKKKKGHRDEETENTTPIEPTGLSDENKVETVEANDTADTTEKVEEIAEETESEADTLTETIVEDSEDVNSVDNVEETKTNDDTVNKD
ncbi:MAG: hypothetical protein PHQ89_03375 [Bacilli bacterium]|nr:hypothetical protein [Bacilli bacterium]